MGLDDAVEGISASDVGPLKAGDMKTDAHTDTAFSHDDRGGGRGCLQVLYEKEVAAVYGCLATF